MSCDKQPLSAEKEEARVTRNQELHDELENVFELGRVEGKVGRAQGFRVAVGFEKVHDLEDGRLLPGFVVEGSPVLLAPRAHEGVSGGGQGEPVPALDVGDVVQLGLGPIRSGNDGAG